MTAEENADKKPLWDLDLGLDGDDIAEAYLGTLAALLTVIVLLAVLYRGRGARRLRH